MVIEKTFHDWADGELTIRQLFCIGGDGTNGVDQKSDSDPIENIDKYY